MAIRIAFLLGAERVIAVDTVPERLELARAAGAITIDFLDEDVYDRIQELTKGRGADACIDAVSTEPLANSSFYAMVDRVKVATLSCVKRSTARAISAQSPSSAYMAVFLTRSHSVPPSNRGMTMRMGQTPVQGYLPKLLAHIENGDIDPSFVITHTASLEEGPDLYKMFNDKKDGCIKVVLKP